MQPWPGSVSRKGEGLGRRGGGREHTGGGGRGGGGLDGRGGGEGDVSGMGYGSSRDKRHKFSLAVV